MFVANRLAIVGKSVLDTVEQLDRHNADMLALVHFGLVLDLADVGNVRQQLVQRVSYKLTATTLANFGALASVDRTSNQFLGLGMLRLSHWPASFASSLKNLLPLQCDPVTFLAMVESDM